MMVQMKAENKCKIKACRSVHFENRKISGQISDFCTKS